MSKLNSGFFVPGENFNASDLFSSICDTLIENGQLIIEKAEGIYRWKIKSKSRKIVIKAEKGETLKIAVAGERQE